MLKFKSMKELFRWRAKFAPRATIIGRNGRYVLAGSVEIEVSSVNPDTEPLVLALDAGAAVGNSQGA